MSFAKDKGYLLDILLAADKINDFLAEETRDSFYENEVLQHAVLRLISIVGEAASKVSHNCRAENSQIPWIDIIGLRHRIVHDYFKLRLAVIWQTVTEDLPALRKEVKSILERDDEV